MKTDRSKDSRTISVLLQGSDQSGSVSESAEPVHSLVWPKGEGEAVFLAQWAQLCFCHRLNLTVMYTVDTNLGKWVLGLWRYVEGERVVMIRRLKCVLWVLFRSPQLLTLSQVLSETRQE